ncbi:MAG: dihydropteroate synthase [Pseudomonadota bacterium]
MSSAHIKSPLIMGILNITPDSFSDGGDAFATEHALKNAQLLWEEGADILDVGAESTRPGAVPISVAEEKRRLEPIIGPLVAAGYRLSIDSYKPEIISYVLKKGFHIVNDIHGFRKYPEIADMVYDHGAEAVLMHNKAEKDDACDIVQDIKDQLSHSVDIALKAGLKKAQIMLDPGIGFGKTFAQNLTIIKSLPELKSYFGLPFLIGASRKAFIGHYLNIQTPKERLYGTLGVHFEAIQRGADAIRVHDVKAHYDMREMLYCLR